MIYLFIYVDCYVCYWIWSYDELSVFESIYVALYFIIFYYDIFCILFELLNIVDILFFYFPNYMTYIVCIARRILYVIFFLCLRFLMIFLCIMVPFLFFGTVSSYFVILKIFYSCSVIIRIWCLYYSIYFSIISIFLHTIGLIYESGYIIFIVDYYIYLDILTVRFIFMCYHTFFVWILHVSEYNATSEDMCYSHFFLYFHTLLYNVFDMCALDLFVSWFYGWMYLVYLYFFKFIIFLTSR